MVVIHPPRNGQVPQSYKNEAPGTQGTETIHHPKVFLDF